MLHLTQSELFQVKAMWDDLSTPYRTFPETDVTWKDLKTLQLDMPDLQYCAKVMQTIIDEYRALFSRFIADISAKHRMDCRTLKR